MQDSDAIRSGDLAIKQPHLVLACVLGLCAALAAWGVLQSGHPFFTVSDQYSIGMGASNEARDALASEQARVTRLNAAIIFAVGGAAFAGLMSIFAPACCVLPVRFISACVAGLMWGAVTGFVGPTVFSMLMPQDALPSPTHVGLAQALAFALFGAGMGLIYTMLARDKSKALTTVGGGAIAGAMGAVAFPVVLSLALPSASAVEFISEGAVVRLLWLGLPMVAIAAGVNLGAASSPKSNAANKTVPAVTEFKTAE
jgi:hypothetical protein